MTWLAIANRTVGLAAGQLLYVLFLRTRSRAAATWYAHTWSQWQDATGLTRQQVRDGLKKLRDLHLIETKRSIFNNKLSLHVRMTPRCRALMAGQRGLGTPTDEGLETPTHSGLETPSIKKDGTDYVNEDGTPDAVAPGSGAEDQLDSQGGPDMKAAQKGLSAHQMVLFHQSKPATPKKGKPLDRKEVWLDANKLADPDRHVDLSGKVLGQLKLLETKLGGADRFRALVPGVVQDWPTFRLAVKKAKGSNVDIGATPTAFQIARHVDVVLDLYDHPMQTIATKVTSSALSAKPAAPKPSPATPNQDIASLEDILAPPPAKGGT